MASKKILIITFVGGLLIIPTLTFATLNFKNITQAVTNPLNGTSLYQLLSPTTATFKNKSISTISRISVPRGKIIPQTDGEVNLSEWKDAARYNLITDKDIKITAYFKTFEVNTPFPDPARTNMCLLYPQTNPNYKVPCGTYLAMAFQGNDIKEAAIFFDEGNDGWRGSRSGDTVLNYRQEDVKMFDNFRLWNIFCNDYFGYADNCPQPCTPWNEKNCYKCQRSDSHSPSGTKCYYSENPDNLVDPIPGYVNTVLDGFQAGVGDCMSSGGGWCIIGPGGGTDTYFNLNLIAMANEKNTGAEMIMPLWGVDLENHQPCRPWNLFCDLSDVRARYGDTINIAIDFVNLGRWPNQVNIGDATTYSPMIIR